ncbi:MAG: HAD-IA family hydrolase [Desulfatiglandales bacterium]|jgi:HAD superfamily hydrolase (TIGR01549 family)|nr:HAD-IA family hydrolase [Desulfatiglandales bacterium]
MKIDETIHEALATLAMGSDEDLFQGCDYADLFNRSIGQAGKLGLPPQKTLEKLSEVYDRYDLDALDRWGPKDNALFVLKNLIMRGVLTGLVTNVGLEALSIFLQCFPFQRLFKVVVTRNHVGRLKSDGERVFRAMKTLKVEKQKCLYVGDSVNDIITT